ncbi:sugar ABC transporter ATP-binding protein [Conexibacter sp. CPCC 206217]|nr:sugar ABC transporter ATP-binding protein [Conexibacter sp. CPCC 206217]MDO8208774.1 sugar ABC transporter ATP-binding protein [Conexibacter sp. CPCC 206217]
MRGIAKRFGGVRALEDVSLRLDGGQVHALLGENGAGKSTLIKVLAGVHRPDEGELSIDGRSVELHSPRAAQAQGIATIYQHPALFPDLDVAENVFLGHTRSNRAGRLEKAAMRREADEILATLGVRLRGKVPVRGLSLADQQVVEIARALSLHARVLIMDEPTASLSAPEVARLFEVVRRLRDRGVAILFISHRLDEVAALADRVTILRDGRHVLTRPAAELERSDLIAAMVGRRLDALYPKAAAEIGAPVLTVRGLARSGAFEGIDLDVRAGEIVGLAGLVGAGRTEIARAIFGIDRLDAGTIEIDGTPVRIGSPADAVAQGIAYVPEDRPHHGLILTFDITANASLPLLRRLGRHGLRNRPRERQIAAEAIADLRIRAAGAGQLTGSLSGGNQQKVVLAKWLATSPRVLILDEPTQGIDVGTKAEVHRLISGLAQQGLAILLISSELPEVLAMSDRIVVIREGRVGGRLTREQATQETIMHAATSEVPLAA